MIGFHHQLDHSSWPYIVDSEFDSSYVDIVDLADLGVVEVCDEVEMAKVLLCLGARIVGGRVGIHLQ